MPLPLGHAAIGWTAHTFISGKNPSLSNWRQVIFVTLFANSPDIDVISGLLLYGNGSALHRGPTHSLLFALLVALLASNAWRLGRFFPRMDFGICFSLILSHVLADLFLTNTPISFCWPLEVHWSLGHTGWADIFNSVLFDSFQDAGIVICCGVVLLFSSYAKRNHLFPVIGAIPGSKGERDPIGSYETSMK